MLATNPSPFPRSLLPVFRPAYACSIIVNVPAAGLIKSSLILTDPLTTYTHSTGRRSHTNTRTESHIHKTITPQICSSLPLQHLQHLNHLSYRPNAAIISIHTTHHHTPPHTITYLLRPSKQCTPRPTPTVNPARPHPPNGSNSRWHYSMGTVLLTIFIGARWPFPLPLT